MPEIQAEAFIAQRRAANPVLDTDGVPDDLLLIGQHVRGIIRLPGATIDTHVSGVVESAFGHVTVGGFPADGHPDEDWDEQPLDGADLAELMVVLP